MQAVTSRAKVLEKNVETRAKGYGVPVDEYKTKVTDIASGVIEKGQNAYENLQAKAQHGEKRVQKKGELAIPILTFEIVDISGRGVR